MTLSLRNSISAGTSEIRSLVVGARKTPLLLRDDKVYKDSIEITFVGYAGRDEAIGPNLFFTPKP